MRWIACLGVLLASRAVARAECPPPGLLWVEPDSPTNQYATNVRVHVAVTDAAPGASVSGTITNDETADAHTLTWETTTRDTGLAPGAAEGETSVHQSLHVGTPDPVLLPDAHYTFAWEITLADGSAGGTGEQAIWTAAEADVLGPAVNGRFSAEVAAVAPADSCAFGTDELLFTFQADDLHADGGDSDALQATLFQVTVRDDEGLVLYDTGYYTGQQWSAVAARFEGRPDLCFDVGATDIYGNRTNYHNDYCVTMPGYETPDAGPDGGTGGDDEFEASNGCFCQTGGTGGGEGALAAASVVLLALGRRRFLTRRRPDARPCP